MAPSKHSSPPSSDQAVAGLVARVSTPKAFFAILFRDFYVASRQLPTFLAQVIIQPLLMLFVFGKILAALSYTRSGYASLLFPGLVALTAVMTGLQGTMLPLVMEFSYTREIEDRLLAPLSTYLVAVEKLVFSTLRAIVAAAIMFPLGIVVLGSIPWRSSSLLSVITIVILAGMAGAALGLGLGTFVPPTKISIVFALVITPLIFTGCSQYPWPSLSKISWFQVVTAFNPITYASEGMRAALTPGVPHISEAVCILALVFSVSVLSSIGIWGFLRRALT